MFSTVNYSPHYLAFDVEATGALSVGFVLADHDGAIKDMRRFDFEGPSTTDDGKVVYYGDFECWDQVWTKYTTPALRTYSTPQQMAEWVDNIYKQFSDVKLLTNEPFFDSMVDRVLEAGGRRSVICTSTYRRTIKDLLIHDNTRLYLLLEDIIRKATAAVAPYDHNPVNGAHHILVEYFCLKAFVCSLRV